MRMRFENYGINDDAHGYQVKKFVKVTDEKSKNFGDEREVTIGFYPSLELACSKMIERMANDGLDFTTVDKWLMDYKGYSEQLITALREIIK